MIPKDIQFVPKDLVLKSTKKPGLSIGKPIWSKSTSEQKMGQKLGI
jgi:hypothetical protein